MKHRWENRYTIFQKQLEECRSFRKMRVEWIECCFQVSLTAITELISDVSSKGFINSEEEIQFFKEVKPKFLSEVEYFRLLYHVELFLPEEEEAVEGFWTREGERLDKFISEHREFYEYIKSGQAYNDRVFFTHCEHCGEGSLGTTIQEGEEFKSSHDGLLATMMALEKYRDYVERKLGRTDNCNN